MFDLLASYDYCMVLINGTRVTSTYVSPTGTIPSSRTATTLVGSLAETVMGNTDECYEWYVIASGDTYAMIKSTYSITLDHFISLNSYVDAACDKILPNYA